jgi:phosphatidylglycerophosphate synthase
MIKEKLPAWGKISGNVGATFARLPFRPNFYTWLTVVIAAIGLLAVIVQHPNIGLTLFIMAGLCDIVDGGLARHLGVASAAGAFLDGSLDRFVDFAVIFSYFWLPITTPLFAVGQWVAIAVFVAIIPSFEVAYANHRKAVDDPHEVKIWRILNRGEMYPLMLAVILASNFSAIVAGWLLVLWVVLALITTFQTLYIALKLAK